MATFSTVRVEQDGHVAILSLNRPSRFNSINDDMFRVGYEALRTRNNPPLWRQPGSFVSRASQTRAPACFRSCQPPSSTSRRWTTSVW